jgi:hypothetical protein
VRKGARVPNAFRREAIERRRQAPAIPERSHSISPQRVDRDEKDVGAPRLPGSERGLSSAAPARERDRSQDRETEDDGADCACSRWNGHS